MQRTTYQMPRYVMYNIAGTFSPSKFCMTTAENMETLAGVRVPYKN